MLSLLLSLSYLQTVPLSLSLSLADVKNKTYTLQTRCNTYVYVSENETVFPDAGRNDVPLCPRTSGSDRSSMVRLPIGKAIGDCFQQT